MKVWLVIRTLLWALLQAFLLTFAVLNVAVVGAVLYTSGVGAPISPDPVGVLLFCGLVAWAALVGRDAIRDHGLSDLLWTLDDA